MWLCFAFSHSGSLSLSEFGERLENYQTIVVDDEPRASEAFSLAISVETLQCNISTVQKYAIMI